MGLEETCVRYVMHYIYTLAEGRQDIEVPSRVHGKRRYHARGSDSVSSGRGLVRTCFSYDKKDNIYTRFIMRLAR